MTFYITVEPVEDGLFYAECRSRAEGVLGEHAATADEATRLCALKVLRELVRHVEDGSVPPRLAGFNVVIR